MPNDACSKYVLNSASFGLAELESLLSAIQDRYDFDFKSYSKASLFRRVNRLFLLDHFSDFNTFTHAIIADRIYFDRFVQEVTVNVTEMFRDPGFFKELRENVLPRLDAYPLIRIWHAGCSTGEEVFSVAIILKELNLFHKSLLYATDINSLVVTEASRGIISRSQLKRYEENYLLSGGLLALGAYYTEKANQIAFNETLLSRMVFSSHNLVSDKSFNEFQLIICRNVLIYFNRQLQNSVFKLFDDSLDRLGYLALGSRETLKFSLILSKFKSVSEQHKIWRKIS